MFWIYLLGMASLISLSSGSCERSHLCECIGHPSFEAWCNGHNMDNVPGDLDPQLRRLDLSYNRITYLSSMAGYPALEDLKLSHNLIASVGSDCFRSNYDIHSLDLSHNKLGTLQKYDLAGLHSLVSLDLSNNEIDFISSSAFSSLNSLQSLNLKSNRLATGEGFPQNLFTQVNRQKLRNLDLSDNLFLSIPHIALQNMEDLSDLDLSYNKFGKIEASVFLNLGKKLSNLNLANCDLHTLGSNAFTGLNTLRQLDLSSNYLTEIPNEAFRKLQNLEILYIGTNKFENIFHNDFSTLENLAELDINGCHRHGLNIAVHLGAFNDNSNLAVLNITKCPGLVELDSSFSLQDLPSLRSVSLHGCGLPTIPHRLLDWTDMDHFDLSNNPIQCDCRNHFLVDILKDHMDWEKVICTGPAGMEGRELEDLEEGEMGCGGEGDNGLVLGLTLGLVFIFLVFVALGILVWKKKPWITSFRQNRRNRKRLSANFTGKDSIKVLQNLTMETDKRFIPLPGLDSHNETETDAENNPIYAEVSETVPNYHIPLGTASFPDIKISEI